MQSIAQDADSLHIDRRELTFISPTRYTEDYFREFMSAIHMPCCIILADDGLYKKPEEIRTKARLIKNHNLYFIPGNHHVHMPKHVHGGRLALVHANRQALQVLSKD